MVLSLRDIDPHFYIFFHAHAHLRVKPLGPDRANHRTGASNGPHDINGPHRQSEIARRMDGLTMRELPKYAIYMPKYVIHMTKYAKMRRSRQ